MTALSLDVKANFHFDVLYALMPAGIVCVKLRCQTQRGSGSSVKLLKKLISCLAYWPCSHMLHKSVRLLDHKPPA